MKKIAIAAGLAGVVLFAGTAWADEAKKDEHAGHGTTQVQPAAKQEAVKSPVPSPAPAPAADAHAAHNMTTEEHSKMSTPAEQHATSSTDAHASHGSTGSATSNGTHESSSTGGHGSHENVVETPPNLPVLYAFGAVNAAFILIGIWNKRFRKKEGLA